MADKMHVHDTLASLALEGKPEPYRLGVKGGIITFPDPADMDFEAGETFLNDLVSARRIEDVFGRWLSAGDWAKLKASKPTLGQLKVLTERVQKHYEYIFGAPGEGSASATY